MACNLRHPMGLRHPGYGDAHLEYTIESWNYSIGCLKLQAILHKRATNYRALLRKMTYKYVYDLVCVVLCIESLHICNLSFNLSPCLSICISLSHIH